MDNTNERKDKTLNAASAGKLLPKKVKAKNGVDFDIRKNRVLKRMLMPKVENNRNPQPVPTTTLKCETVPQLF